MAIFLLLLVGSGCHALVAPLRHPGRAPGFLPRVSAPCAAAGTILPLEAEPAQASTLAGRSALVLGWFHASERELAYVRKLYLRHGFTDVVVRPSVIGKIAKPRGWYRSIRRGLRQEAIATQATTQALVGGRGKASASEPDVSRHFDVVHCLSGGFLSLYVLLRSGNRLTYDTLLLDSTPILPKPVAYTRFARAFLAAAGWMGKLSLLLVPGWLHTGVVRARWWLGMHYILARHKLTRWLGRSQDESLDEWTGGPVSWALSGDWDRVARHAIGTVLAGFDATRDAATSSSAPSPSATSPSARRPAALPKLILLHNPSDPFLDPTDVQLTASLASAVGIPTVVLPVRYDHVQALFASPRTIFDVLGATKTSGKAAAMASGGEAQHSATTDAGEGAGGEAAPHLSTQGVTPGLAPEETRGAGVAAAGAAHGAYDGGAGGEGHGAGGARGVDEEGLRRMVALGVGFA